MNPWIFVQQLVRLVIVHQMQVQSVHHTRGEKPEQCWLAGRRPFSVGKINISNLDKLSSLNQSLWELPGSTMTMSAFPTGHRANVAASDLWIGLLSVIRSYRTHWAASGLSTSYLWYLLLRMKFLDDGDVCAECNHSARRVTWTNTNEYAIIEHVIDSFSPT